MNMKLVNKKKTKTIKSFDDNIKQTVYDDDGVGVGKISSVTWDWIIITISWWYLPLGFKLMIKFKSYIESIDWDEKKVTT